MTKYEGFICWGFSESKPSAFSVRKYLLLNIFSFTRNATSASVLENWKKFGLDLGYNIVDSIDLIQMVTFALINQGG